MKDTSNHPKNLKPALLIIDVQNRYMQVIPGRDKEIAFFFINLLIELFRKNDFPIYRIYHSNEKTGPMPGNDEFEFPDAIRIKPEDTQIIKTYSDSFNKTNLNAILKENGIDTLFLCDIHSGIKLKSCALSYDERAAT